ncbi:energy-coupling factor transporter transmembrane component T family protein [Jatrophihabitans sp. YIM 134969]
MTSWVSVPFAVAIAPTRAARLNPVSKLVALVVPSLPVLITGDVPTAVVLLVGEVIALMALGIGPRTVLRYGWPFVLGLVGVTAANWVASGSLDAVPGVAARLLAIALPGLLLVLSTEPVDLADALVQKLHAPARFAYGALAAFRLLPLLGEEWMSLRRARRARGIDAGRNPVAAVRIQAGLLFAVLVAAIRRATRLALAMDARGFGARPDRTFARTSRFTALDTVFVGGTVLLTAVAVVVGLYA